MPYGNLLYSAGKYAYPLAKTYASSYAKGYVAKKAYAMGRGSRSRSAPAMRRSYGYGRTKRRGKIGAKPLLKKKAGLKGRRATKAYIGRDWPPTEMTAAFEKQITVPISAAMSADPDCSGAQKFIYVDSLIPENSRLWNQNDAAGVNPTSVKIDTLVVPAMDSPRNWDQISAHYNRVRHVKTRVAIRLNLDSSDAAVSDRAYDVWTYISSDQDNANPMADGELGTASATFVNGQWWQSLMASRRVKHSTMLGTNRGVGGKTFYATLGHKSDRLKNTIGEHVSVITNHPMGVTNPMDTTIAEFESATAQLHGVNNKFNIIWCPKDRKAGQIESISIKYVQTVRFYDRQNANT